MTKNTAECIVNAALLEFCENGYFATDTNKIARRAGFAPQTFYRWFKDKIAVFLAAYKQWSDLEIQLLAVLPLNKEASEQVVDIVIMHHREYRMFRRSLRQLGVENLEVRQARAENRLKQLSFLQQKLGLADTHRVTLLASMLQIERLADALVEGEFDDLGVQEADIKSVMINLISELFKHSFTALP